MKRFFDIRNRLKKLNNILGKKNKGMTMVELIVSFALLSLFMVAATKAISNTVVVYYEAKGIQTGMQLSNILSAKIVGEIESAITTEINSDNCAMVLKDNGDVDYIDFFDRYGSHVRLSLENGYFLLYYYPIEYDENTTEEEMLTLGEKWTYDKKLYMGYTITKLNFSKADSGYGENVIRMDMTLHSGKYGDYQTTQYIECYNFDTVEKQSKIMEK